MYTVTKEFEISAAHKLKLHYDSPCTSLHGHNWKIKVTCRSNELNRNGMVIDFKLIKKAVQDKLDHKCLNEVLKFNPTAENIAEWIYEGIPYCVKVEVQESEGNVAIYERD